MRSKNVHKFRATDFDASSCTNLCRVELRCLVQVTCIRKQLVQQNT